MIKFIKSLKIGSLWRQGWVEIPELMSAGCGGAVVMSAMGLYVVYRFWGIPMDLTRKYMEQPIILRPGDPKIAKINNYSKLDGWEY